MYYKVIDNGHVIEVYEMERPPFDVHSLDKMPDYDALAPMSKAARQADYERYRSDRKFEEQFRGDRKDERRAQTLRDARNLCRRLAVANFESHDCFMTLTVRENSRDVKKYDEEFKKFIKRFNYKYGKKHKYLAVRQFQARGAIHYHLLIDWHTDRTDYFALNDEVGEIWGHGWVKSIWLKIEGMERRLIMSGRISFDI